MTIDVMLCDMPHSRVDPGMISPIVVMGVSGSGKSTVGAALAWRLRVPFADADDFHPPANIAKMTAGQALDDDDRYPWLEVIGEWLVEHDGGGVMSCLAILRRVQRSVRPGERLSREPVPRCAGCPFGVSAWRR